MQTSVGCAPACAVESPKLDERGAAPRQPAIIFISNLKFEISDQFGVVADKQCTCPASKLMWERYPPTPPAFARRLPGRSEAKAGHSAAHSRHLLRAAARQAISLRETRLKYREKPHKLLQVGVIPTPATSLRQKAAAPKRSEGGHAPVNCP